MSSASVPPREIEVGKTYTTTSGRKLRVIEVYPGGIAYTIKGEGLVVHRATPRVFLAATRG